MIPIRIPIPRPFLLLAAIAVLLLKAAPALAGQEQFGPHVIEQAKREVAAALKKDVQYRAIPEPERQRYQHRQVAARVAALTRPTLDFMQQRVDKRLDQLLDKALDRIGDGAISASTKREIRQWFKPLMYVHGHETQGENNKIRRVFAAAEGQTMDITDENEILRDSVGSSDNIQMFEGTIATIISRRLNPILSQPLSDSQVSAMTASLMGQLQSIK